jgi:hypothetical protein
MAKDIDKIYTSVKTLKSYGSQLSSDSEEEEDKNKNKFNKDNTNELFSVDEYLQKDNCTFFNLGSLPINQKCYTCSICNHQRKDICEYCYSYCHQACRENKLEFQSKPLSNSIENKDYKGIKEFYCLCGSEYKHNPPIPIIIEHGPCDLMKLDKALKLDNFYCEFHNVQICCVCYVQCHSECRKKPSKLVNDKNKSRRYRDKCFCKNECHTSYNEVAFSFPLDKYQELSGVHIWPIQILNILFRKETFGKLIHLFTSIINREEVVEEGDKKERKFISLLESFSNTFNRKFKTFYYHEKILEMFDYGRLIKYIHTIEIKKKINKLKNYLNLS